VKWFGHLPPEGAGVRTCTTGVWWGCGGVIGPDPSTALDGISMVRGDADGHIASQTNLQHRHLTRGSAGTRGGSGGTRAGGSDRSGSSGSAHGTRVCQKWVASTLMAATAGTAISSPRNP
jgi:hypothetical protein